MEEDGKGRVKGDGNCVSGQLGHLAASGRETQPHH